MTWCRNSNPFCQIIPMLTPPPWDFRIDGRKNRYGAASAIKFCILNSAFLILHYKRACQCFFPQAIKSAGKELLKRVPNGQFQAVGKTQTMRIVHPF